MIVDTRARMAKGTERGVDQASRHPFPPLVVRSVPLGWTDLVPLAGGLLGEPRAGFADALPDRSAAR